MQKKIGRGTIVADKKTQDMAQFYNECQNKGYTDMQDETQSLKAKVIAMDLGLNYRKIAELYKEAERCAKIVHQEEEQKSIRAKKAAEEKEKLAAKQAVPGTLILELMSSKEGPSGKRVQVFHRPDGTIYSLIVPGSYRVEGAPSISIHSSSATLFTYTPDKTIFTSATVGGITTGGFDTIKGGYSASSSRSGKGYLALKLLSDDFTIMRCKIPADVCKVFRRDPLMSMCDSDGEIKVFQESSLANTYRTAMFAPGNDVYRTMSALSLAQDEERLSLSTCSKIVDLVAKIINGPWPPTDQQLFDEACAQGESNESKIVEKALKTINELEKQPDLPIETLSTKKKELQQRYDDMVQAEKEALVLLEEARATKTKKALAIGIPVFVLFIAAVLFFTRVFVPNTKYQTAISLVEAGQYEKAITVFEALDGYKDSAEQINKTHLLILEKENSEAYSEAERLFNEGQFDEAEAAFRALEDYRDAMDRVDDVIEARNDSMYHVAVQSFDNSEYSKAYQQFFDLNEYLDSAERAQLSAACAAEQEEQNGNLEAAIDWYRICNDIERVRELQYSYVKTHFDKSDPLTYSYLGELSDASYMDSAKLYDKLFSYEIKVLFNTSYDDLETNKTTITANEGPWHGFVNYHVVVKGGYPLQEYSLKILYEARKGIDRAHLDDWEIVTSTYYNKPAIVTCDKPFSSYIDWYVGKTRWVEGKGHFLMYNYYHRISVYNAENDELICSAVLYTPVK